MGRHRTAQRAARAVQAECGVRYTTALAWVKENMDAILEMIIEDDEVQWKELKQAACGLWRRNHNGR